MDSRIAVIYGHDAAKMTRALLEHDGTAERIGGRDASIVLKPNLVVPSDPSQGATTHTEIVEEIVSYLKENGFRGITIAEGAWVGASTEEAYRKLGYHRIRDRYGVKLLDTKKDRYRRLSPCSIPMEISETILDADFIIDIPVLKGHCQTKMTHAMKNLKGCISDRSKRDFHKEGLMKPIAALNMLIRPDLTIVDSICGDLDFEEGGTPVETDRMMLSEDPAALDMLGASLMGYSPKDIGYIQIAAGYSGRSLNLENIDIIQLNNPATGNIRPRGTVSHLASYTAPDEACSACYAALIHAIKRLEEEGDIGKLGSRKVAVGQGWKGKKMELGSGLCCKGAEHAAIGCPPSASDILSMLEEL